MQPICIVGPGRIGGSLAIAFSKACYRVTVAVRDLSRLRPELGERIVSVELTDLPSVDAEVFILAVPDTEIERAAADIAPLLSGGRCVLHTSGSLDSSLLHPFRDRGIAAASMHPLVSISDPHSGSEMLAGKYFCIEGDTAAGDVASGLARAIGGKPFTIGTEYKPLYHASAVMAAGNMAALFNMAAEMLAKCGVERKAANDMLMPLTRSALRNIEDVQPGEGLTGSFARFDAAAFERHMASIDQNISPEIRETFILLGEYTARISAAAQGREGDVAELLEKIKIAKGFGE